MRRALEVALVGLLTLGACSQGGGPTDPASTSSSSQ